MSEQSNEKSADEPAEGISDEQLPDDLLPSEDNPLAEPLTDEEAPDDIDELDLMGGGSDGDSDQDSDDERSADGESAPEDTED
jgi:hypothetical protein